MSIFIQHPDIKGETSDKNHQGCIDALEVEFGVSRAITSATSTQGDRESSNAVISDLTFTKWMDKATPYLFIETMCGRGKTIKIYMTKTGAGDGADVFLEYTLENALFSKMDTEMMAYDNARPLEIFKISFTSMSVKYIQYDEDGNMLAPQAVGFDTATNTKH
ncbi:MAG: Hcp family type VI secretion system effector [Cellvibrionaceae bacterium]